LKLIPLIVTYNRLHKLRISINKWLNTKVYKIVIVNNNSTDGTKEYLATISKNSKRIEVINLLQNTGGAGGFYKGLKYIHNEIKDYDWVVLHDDDAYPDINSIDYFMKEKDVSTADAYMSAVFYPSNKISPMNMPGYFPFKNLKQAIKTILKGNNGFHIDINLYNQDKEIDIDFASFVGLFVSKKVIEKLGFPKKDFFIYGDDLEYTIRITKNKFKIKFDPKLKFFHDCETLHEEKRKIYKPIWKAYFTYRNGIIIYEMLSGKMFPLVMINKTLSWFFNGLYYKNKKIYYEILIKALKDGLKRNISENIKIIEKYNKYQ